MAILSIKNLSDASLAAWNREAAEEGLELREWVISVLNSRSRIPDFEMETLTANEVNRVRKMIGV
jgi:hypothetical protein